MIARTWHGKVPAGKADEYYAYMLRTGVQGCQSVAGNRGVFIFRRIEAGEAHFLFYSLWDSWEAIRAFAGKDVDRARYYPEDADYLLEPEPTVTHYEVLLAPAGTR